MKRERITALVAAAASGRAADGWGPQRFGQPRRHHTTPAVTHVSDAATVAAIACRRQRAVAHATPRSIGK
jgi:hypothetical protein